LNPFLRGEKQKSQKESIEREAVHSFPPCDQQRSDLSFSLRLIHASPPGGQERECNFNT